MSTDLPLRSVSVGAVVLRHDHQVLVIERGDNGRLATPGGVLELGEAPEDGLRREVFEETGLIVRPEILTGVYTNLVTGVVSLVFRCRPVAGHPRAGDDATDAMWTPVDKALQMVHTIYAVRIQDALLPGGPFIRAHDGDHVLDE